MPHTVRRAQASEAPLLQDFIHRHWKAGHPLAISRTLLDWQHLDATTGLYNFVVAVDDATGQWDGAFGYIPTHHFDAALATPQPDVWTALWKVVLGAGALLGLQLYAAIERETHFGTFCAFGINAEVERLYLLLKHRAHSVGHYFRPNRAVLQPRLWKPSGAFSIDKEPFTGSRATLRPLTSLADLADAPAAAYRPVKSLAYLQNRYERHPFYRYLFYLVENQGRPVAIWVLRRVEAAPDQPPPPSAHQGGEPCALRLIDVLGSVEACAGLAPALDGLLATHGAEYLDVRTHGLPDTVWQAAGLRPIAAEAGEVVPEYFEPFVQQNVNLRFALREKAPDAPTAHLPYVLFKGDGDQDRPNRLLVP